MAKVEIVKLEAHENRRGSEFITGTSRIMCLDPHCNLPAKYLIGSLENEIAGKQKFGYYCEHHEHEIALDNGNLVLKAAVAGMPLVEYIAELKAEAS